MLHASSYFPSFRLIRAVHSLTSRLLMPQNGKACLLPNLMLSSTSAGLARGKVVAEACRETIT